MGLLAGQGGGEPDAAGAKTHAVSRLRMGLLDKVVLRFPEVFWPNDRDYLGYASATHGEFPVFLNAHRFTGQPALMAFVGGDFARALEKQSDEAIADNAMAVLRRIAGPGAHDPVDGIASRWAADPYAHGSYSYIPVGASPADYDRLAAPVAGRLFFAGEATIKEYYATVHGGAVRVLEVPPGRAGDAEESTGKQSVDQSQDVEIGERRLLYHFDDRRVADQTHVDVEFVFRERADRHGAGLVENDFVDHRWKLAHQTCC